MLRNGSVPTRGGARAGRASWRRKHAGLTEGGNTPTRGLFGLVTASTSHQARPVVHVPGPHLDTPDARDDQPDRKHERAPTPDAARPPRHGLDPTHESRVLVVLHPLSAPPASSDNPGHHAHRHNPRKRLAPSPSNPPSHRHHPRLGRRNLLKPTPPHHPLPQHPGLTPSNTCYPITRLFSADGVGTVRSEGRDPSGSCLCRLRGGLGSVGMPASRVSLLCFCEGILRT